MISILLPAYKQRFLKEAIDSILAQSYRDFELIIVNDASPENLQEVIDKYEDERIQYYINPQNIGGRNLVENWNLCLSYAKGEFVVLASDDDIYAPTFLEKMIGLANKYPDINLFHSRTCIINSKGEIISKGTPLVELESDIEFIYKRAILRRPQVISDFLFRTKALREKGGFTDYPRAWYADEMTVDKMAAHKGVAASTETCFFWRSSDINISSLNHDTVEKANASLMFYEQMKKLLLTLSPITEEDKSLLETINTSIGDSIAKQLHFDLSHTSFTLLCRILGNKKYNTLLSNKWKLRIILRFIGSKIRRCLLHLSQ